MVSHGCVRGEGDEKEPSAEYFIMLLNGIISDSEAIKAY